MLALRMVLSLILVGCLLAASTAIAWQTPERPAEVADPAAPQPPKAPQAPTRPAKVGHPLRAKQPPSAAGSPARFPRADDRSGKAPVAGTSRARYPRAADGAVEVPADVADPAETRQPLSGAKAVAGSPGVRAADTALARQPFAAKKTRSRKQLQREVESAFAVRQKQQRAELKQLKARLQRIEAAIEAREKHRKRIIERRVEELLNPALRWTEPRTGNPYRKPARWPRATTPTAPSAGPAQIPFSSGGSKKPAATSSLSGPRRTGSVSRAKISSLSPGVSGSVVIEQAPVVASATSASVRVQVAFQQPRGAHVRVQTPDRKELPLVIPGRIPATTNSHIAFHLSKISSHRGAELTGSVQIPPASAPTKQFLQHSSIAIRFTVEDIDHAISGRLVTRVLYLPTGERDLNDLASVAPLRNERLDPGVDPLGHARSRGFVVAIVRLGNRSKPPVSGRYQPTHPRAKKADIIGTDPGTPIYNDKLKRFKFRLEKIKIQSAAEAAQEFWNVYKDRGNPEITGVWADPRTNSLVIVGSPEADQAIRDSIARWEGAQGGIDFRADGSLDAQLRELEQHRRGLITQATEIQLAILDEESQAGPNAKKRVEERKQRLTEVERELRLVEKKIDVVRTNLKEVDPQEDPAEEPDHQALERQVKVLQGEYHAGNAGLAELLAAFRALVDHEHKAAGNLKERREATQRRIGFLTGLQLILKKKAMAGQAGPAEQLAVDRELAEARQDLGRLPKPSRSDAGF